MSTSKSRNPIAGTKKHSGAPSRSAEARLDALVEEATIDAHDGEEQRTGFFTALDNDLALPFVTDVLGVEVTVERIDFNDAQEIVAICRRGGQRQAISIVDLPLPSPPPAGAEWIAAYRHWAKRR